jgi:NAD(P)-dependent dehydrogenase (short-subunit alcohol dehydrogenase family)
MNLFDLTGKVAVVTGSSGQLGPVWCKTLRDAGAKVFEIDLPRWDVSDRAFIDDAHYEFSCVMGGAPDIIVNNAGIDVKPGEQANFWTWEKIIAVNLGGCVNVCQAFLPDMVKSGKGGNIINIGSLLGSIASDPRKYASLGNFDKSLGYGASKAAIHNFTMNLAVRMGQHNIRVNTLSPSAFKYNQPEEFTKAYLRDVPMGRYAEAGDYATALLFLAVTTYCTGHELKINGGYTTW